MIKVTSQHALKHWRIAGWINPRINSGLFGGFHTDFIANIKVYFDRNQLIKIPIKEKFFITYIVPSWVFDISLSIWEYQGSEIELSELKPILREIDKKVSDISDFQ